MDFVILSYFLARAISDKKNWDNNFFLLGGRGGGGGGVNWCKAFTEPRME